MVMMVAAAVRNGRWEIGNEVDYEHGHTPQSYTLEFDAIVSTWAWFHYVDEAGASEMGGTSFFPRCLQVSALWASVDPDHALLFNGMNLPNIDNLDTVVTWAQYFLNTSNHSPQVAAGAATALASIGYHAYPTQVGSGHGPVLQSRTVI